MGMIDQKNSKLHFSSSFCQLWETYFSLKRQTFYLFYILYIYIIIIYLYDQDQTQTYTSN